MIVDKDYRKLKEILPTSEHLKCWLIKWFRIKNHYPLVATEVLCDYKWQADVLTSDYKKIIEVEIKVSLSDLKNDFIKKAGKHESLSGKVFGEKRGYVNNDKLLIPNYFYFAVPEKILNKAYKIIKDTPYGLLCIHSGHYNNDDYITKIKESNKLNNIYPEKLEKLIIKRMSSEIFGLRRKILELKNEFENKKDLKPFDFYNWLKENDLERYNILFKNFEN